MTRLIVDRQGAQLRKDGARLQVQLQDEVIQSVPLEPLEQVILMGRGISASTPLLFDLVQRGVDVVYLSQGGRFAFRLAGPLAKHSALRARQVLVAADAAQALALARASIAGKLHNQAALLGRYGEALGEAGAAALDGLDVQSAHVEQAASLESLRGYEGQAASLYFGAWRLLFDATGWGFQGRAYHPPRDPVNAMLSLGYTLLLNDLQALLYRIGLDPAIGFFHTVDYGRPSLALDLEEEFRPVLVDALVLGILRQRLLIPTDFRVGEPGVEMTDDARRFYLTRYEERLQVPVRHPRWEQNLTYRQCLERQVEHLARCILGRDAVYQPLLMA